MKKLETQGVKKLKLEDFEVGRTLGKGKLLHNEGGFGKVKVAKNKKNGKYVALKLLKKSEIIKAQQIDHVYNENFIHSQINHPFIVSFEGLAQDSRYLYLVLELINGGELFTYLRSVESLSSDQCRFYAATVTSCFEYLHSKNIIFRDLKPENLLIGNDGYLKLTDFGFAKILNEGRTFTICGTPEYIAPEVILNQGHGKAVDWWTLGVLIYEMHAGIDPFSDDDTMGIYKNILKGKVSFPSIFDKEAREAKSLIRHLLVADLSKRYGNLKDGTFFK